jgi:hypothetical protein
VLLILFAILLLCLAEVVAVIGLWKRGTHVVVPVYQRGLPPDVGEALTTGSFRGFRTVGLGGNKFLLRPVLWFEAGPSAAPFFLSVAKADVSQSSVQVRGYAPLGVLLLALLVPSTAIGVPQSPAGVIALVIATSACVWFTVAMYRSEFRACLGRLARVEAAP